MYVSLLMQRFVVRLFHLYENVTFTGEGFQIYTTKGRDRFHWAATPLKPYKVGNICYMTYRYIVLYFLNLSLKKKIPTENGNFCENIQIRRPLSFHVLTCRACPIDALPNRRYIVHVSASVCSIKGRHIHPVRHAKLPNNSFGRNTHLQQN